MRTFKVDCHKDTKQVLSKNHAAQIIREIESNVVKWTITIFRRTGKYQGKKEKLNPVTNGSWTKIGFPTSHDVRQFLRDFQLADALHELIVNKIAHMNQ